MAEDIGAHTEEDSLAEGNPAVGSLAADNPAVDTPPADNLEEEEPQREVDCIESLFLF